MKIAIVGAGVVGIAMAYELSVDGHSVTVFEKNGAAGESASFSNGGIHSNSFTRPLSAAMLHGHRARRMIQAARRLSVSRWYSPPNMQWLWAHTRHSADDRAAKLIEFGQKMALLGAEITDSWISRGQWEVEQSAGQLILLNDASDLERYATTMDALKLTDQASRVLNVEQLESIEPSLEGIDKIQKAIHLPGDRVMNCRQFALLAKQEAQRNGVVFHFNTEVNSISTEGKVQLKTSAGETHTFENIILCTEGPLPKDTLRVRMDLPLARISSYAVSVGIREPLNAPRGAVHDHASGITISRIGKRIRVCGGAELNRPSGAPHDERLVNKLFRTLDQRFPGAAHYASGTQVWRSSTTHTCDGLPLLGPSGLPGVWLNMAHGAYGWTLAAASARLLSEQLVGRETSIPLQPISPDRFQRKTS
jgi:D-amino-acid dehydrogenase